MTIDRGYYETVSNTIAMVHDLITKVEDTDEDITENIELVNVCSALVGKVHRDGILATNLKPTKLVNRQGDTFYEKTYSDVTSISSFSNNTIVGYKLRFYLNKMMKELASSIPKSLPIPRIREILNSHPLVRETYSPRSTIGYIIEHFPLVFVYENAYGDRDKKLDDTQKFSIYLHDKLSSSTANFNFAHSIKIASGSNFRMQGPWVDMVFDSLKILENEINIHRAISEASKQQKKIVDAETDAHDCAKAYDLLSRYEKEAVDLMAEELDPTEPFG